MAGFDVANEFDKAITLWRAEENSLKEDLKAKRKIEARVLDLYRNNDLMRSLVEKQVDSIVGSKVALQCLPDHETLGVSRAEAMEWASDVERQFHAYANSPENWISADRSMDFTQMCRAAERSRIFTGEITASREWRGSPLGYNTCFQVFTSNRIKTPQGSPRRIFEGVELDRYGAAQAYHVESTSLTPMPGVDARTTRRVPRYNRFGWLQLFHIYEPFLAEYPRGISRLACVLKKLKQLDRFHEADLDKAIITTNYVFAITSDNDPDSVADMLSGANTIQQNEFAAQAGVSLPAEIDEKRKEILQSITDRYIETTGGQIAHLFKGEDMKTVAPPNTIQTSDDYAKGHARAITNGAGMSYEYGSGDFQGVNFSGGNLSLGIYDHHAEIQRRLYTHKFARYVFRAWMDEAIAKGRVRLLGGNKYWPNKEAYTRCSFTGAKRVHVDPVKKEKANQLRLANGTASRTDIANEEGTDIESITMNRVSEAGIILKGIEVAAQNAGLTLTDEAKMKVLIDVIGTNTIETPDNVIELEGE